MEKTKPKCTAEGFISDSILERGRKIKLAAEIGLVESSQGRHWSHALRRQILRKKGRSNTGNACLCSEDQNATHAASGFFEALGEQEGGGDVDEVMEIERRVRTLQRLIPGGEALGVETLFEETADYIEALEEQVAAMRTIATLLDGLETEKRRIGGSLA